jgi:hypothetical protein
MEDSKNIEFRGVSAVRLCSCVVKNLWIFYSSRIISPELYNKYNQETFADFLKKNLKKDEFLVDFINLTDFNDDETNLIMSFVKDGNGIRYTPAMIGTLDVIKIKEKIKFALHSLFNLDFYFINNDVPNGELDIREKWKEAAKGGNSNIKIEDIVNL